MKRHHWGKKCFLKIFLPEENLPESGAHEAVDEEVNAGVEGHEAVRDGGETHGPVGHPVAVVLDALEVEILSNAQWA